MDLRARYAHHTAPKIDISKLWVISVVSNTARYQSRYRLYSEFEKHILDQGANLLTVEMAFGERPHAITSSDNPRHIQLRSSFELWHKENMVNVGISRLPSDWQYVAWIDADVHFLRNDILEETVHRLQHYQLVQMFSAAQDIGPHPSFEPIQTHAGFMYCYLHRHMDEIPALVFHNTPKDSVERLKAQRQNIKVPGKCPPYYVSAVKQPGKHFWHPGFAWAARRSAIEHLGGLMDHGILGAGDHHMALALVGRAHEATHPGVTEGYKRGVMTWQERAEKWIRRNVGYVPGTLLHAWHGKKADRKYWDRWKVLADNAFDPAVDLKRDWQGLWQLVDTGEMRSVNLRDQIRQYMSSRNEDSIDLPKT